MTDWPAADRVDSVLAVKFGLLGDLLLADPALAALRARYPKARLRLLADSPRQTAWLRPDAFDELHTVTIGVQHASYRRLYDPRLWRDVLGLRRRPPAAIAVFLNDTLGAYQRRLFASIAWAARARWRVGVKTRETGYLTDGPSPDELTAVTRSRGMADRGGHGARAAAARARRRSRSAARVREVRAHIPARVVVALQPLTAKPAKQWPLPRFVELARAVVERLDGMVVLVGSAAEREALEAFRFLGERSVDTIGLPIAALVGALGECDAFVGHDSGPFHVAVAARTPAVALVGPSDPKYSRYPSAAVRALRRCVLAAEHEECPLYLSCRDLRCLPSLDRGRGVFDPHGAAGLGARAVSPSRPLRVAHVIETLGVGGAERLVADVTRRLDRGRFHSRVFPLDEPLDLRGEIESAGVEVDPVLVAPRRRPVACLRGLRRGSKRVCAGGRPHPPVLRQRDGTHRRASRGRCARHHHAAQPGLHVREPLTPLFAARKLVDRVTGWRNAALVAVSRAVAEDYRRHMGWRTIRVVPNGVDLEALRPAAMQQRRGSGRVPACGCSASGASMSRKGTACCWTRWPRRARRAPRSRCSWRAKARSAPPSKSRRAGSGCRATCAWPVAATCAPASCRGRLRLPLALRGGRDRAARGDGLRPAGRGLAHRRNPRSRGGRRERAARDAGRRGGPLSCARAPRGRSRAAAPAGGGGARESQGLRHPRHGPDPRGPVRRGRAPMSRRAAGLFLLALAMRLFFSLRAPAPEADAADYLRLAQGCGPEPAMSTPRDVPRHSGPRSIRCSSPSRVPTCAWPRSPRASSAPATACSPWPWRLDGWRGPLPGWPGSSSPSIRCSRRPRRCCLSEVLYQTLFLLALLALDAARSPRRAFASGLLAGLSLLVRTAGLPALVVLLALCVRREAPRLKAALVFPGRRRDSP